MMPAGRGKQAKTTPIAAVGSASFDRYDPMRSIIAVDQMRGLDENLRIIDADELALSLEEAGLAAPQVQALRMLDLTLETYVSLINLEVACLRQQGIGATNPKVDTEEYGIQIPSYGYPAEVDGMTEAEIAERQVNCQNRFTGAYQTLYRVSQLPSEEERLRLDLAAANAFLVCARDLGVEVPLNVVDNESSLEKFYTWYASPEADIACSLRP